MGYMQKSRSNARAVALGGMLSALAVAFMSIGSIVPSLDMSSAFIAGIVVIVARLEINHGADIGVPCCRYTLSRSSAEPLCGNMLPLSIRIVSDSQGIYRTHTHKTAQVDCENSGVHGNVFCHDKTRRVFHRGNRRYP